MYTPSAFREDDPAVLHQIMQEARLSTLVTSSVEDGLVATPLPLFLDESEGPFGTLYGHVARANPHWKLTPSAESLVIFPGPDAYISPSFYSSKQEHGQVVPTWNYVSVHAYGEVEFFEDADRLLAVVTRLTNLHEAPRTEPWSVSDAPEAFIAGQLRAIVGLRLPITRLQGKRKVSQNRSQADREGVANGLAQSEREGDRLAARLIPITPR